MVGRTAGGMTDGEIHVLHREYRKKNVRRASSLYNSKMSTIYHVHTTMRFQNVDLTPACSVAASLLVANH